MTKLANCGITLKAYFLEQLRLKKKLAEIATRIESDFVCGGELGGGELGGG